MFTTHLTPVPHPQSFRRYQSRQWAAESFCLEALGTIHLAQLSDLLTHVLDRGEQNELLSQGAHNPPKAAEKASVAGYNYLLNF